MLTPEMWKALRAVEAGDEYAKSGHGPRRAGRTRSLGALMRRELITTSNIGYGFMLTDKGRASLGKPSSEGVP